MNAFEEWKGTLRNPGIDMFIFTRHSTRASEGNFASNRLNISTVLQTCGRCT